jgi:ABC-2 type transport system permease protein
VTARDAVTLVARREISQRVRERSFLLGTLLSLAIIVLVVVLPSALGFGGRTEYAIAVQDPAKAPIAQAAVAGADAFDADLKIEDGAALADVDAVLTRDGIRAREEPDDELLSILQAANAKVAGERALERAGLDRAEADRALNPAPLALSTVEPVNDDADRGGFAFFAVLLLYGQLIGIGIFVAMGVVEEKSSRVVELLLSTLKPAHLLAGKVIGLGLLGLGQLFVLAVIGLVAAAASGAVEVDADLITAVGLALGWFVVGYAFYGAAFACAASLVSRQEDLQSVLTPLQMLLLVGFFLSFAVNSDPDGTLAVVSSFLPPVAPMIMPARIAVGEASATEIVGAFAVTLAAAAILIPLAARIYSGAVLRTGAAVKLRQAWAAARG